MNAFGLHMLWQLINMDLSLWLLRMPQFILNLLFIGEKTHNVL
jgi:hypothetical protein